MDTAIIASLSLPEFVQSISSTLTVPILVWTAAYALEAYFVNVFVLGVMVYGVQTSARRTSYIVSNARAKASEQTNLLLRQYGIIFLCQDILELRMERAKRNVLDMIHFTHKLNMLWTIVDKEADKPKPRLSFFSSSPAPSPSKYSVATVNTTISTPSTDSDGAPTPDWSERLSPWKMWGSSRMTGSPDAKTDDEIPADVPTEVSGDAPANIESQ